MPSSSSLQPNNPDEDVTNTTTDDDAAAATDPNHSKSLVEKSAIENLLGSRIRCTLSDGRTATGRFVCVDRMKNIILADCVEKRWISSADYNPNHVEDNNNHDDDDDNTTANHNNRAVRKIAIRRLQQAMVPGVHLSKVQIASDVYQARVEPILLRSSHPVSAS